MTTRLYVLLILITGMYAGTIMAQADSAETLILTTSPSTHIRYLHQGTLLVRLVSNEKKIEALRSTLEEDGLSESEQKRLQNLLDDAISDKDEDSRSLSFAFDSAFTFCNVAFFYDKDSRKVLSGEQAPYQSDLKTPYEIDLAEPFYILSVGNTPQTSVKGLVILDRNLEPIPKPFPNSVLRSGLPALFASFSGYPDVKHVERLNKKLLRYHERVTYPQ